MYVEPRPMPTAPPGGASRQPATGPAGADLPAGATVPPARDYRIIRAAVAFLTESVRAQPSMAEVADAAGVTPVTLERTFRRWAGLTPKQFLQAVTLDRARRLLDDAASVLDATYELGLSGPARLHDLFVTHDAMTPGAYRARGDGVEIAWGWHPSPFGEALLMVTERGLAGLAFADDAGGRAAAFADMAGRWPRARYVEDPAKTAPYAARIFEPERWRPDTPLRVVLIGTDFEVRVWETLLGIPFARTTTYSTIAERIGRPSAARAVGTAVGRNPISFVVPCHRVVGRSGALHGYHWGLTRKRAMLGWEAGIAGLVRD